MGETSFEGMSSLTYKRRPPPNSPNLVLSSLYGEEKPEMKN